jgi:hypothetical protein
MPSYYPHTITFTSEVWFQHMNFSGCIESITPTEKMDPTKIFVLFFTIAMLLFYVCRHYPLSHIISFFERIFILPFS